LKLTRLETSWLVRYEDLCRDLLRSVPVGRDGDVHETVIGFLEYRLILASLVETGGRQNQAARLLGIHRNTLRRKLSQYREIFEK
jgi:DNA-binding protein Fis